MILKLGKEIPLEDVLHRIEYADHEEIDAMIHAVQRRYKRLFPDWEVTFLSMPLGNEREKRAAARELIRFFQKNYLEE